MPPSPQDCIAAAFADNRCLQLVLSDWRPDAPRLYRKVVVRPVDLRSGRKWQFEFHAADRVVHENLDSAVAARRAAELLRDTFRQAQLNTPEADYAIRFMPDGTWRLRKAPPTKSAVQTRHDRAKEYVIPEGRPCPFLIEIGVMTPGGQVRRAMQHKFRQINRFLELANDAIAALPADRVLQVVDFACGKSYLTFALHHLLTEVCGRKVHLVGLDRKRDVLDHCAELADRLKCQGLEFRAEELAEFSSHAPIDLAVALHACDTATDVALAHAVRYEARVILAAPCCQHELARQIAGDALTPLTRHGILHERFAALATDALRALVLESRGYATQIIEFVDIEHTAKNILLRAVRREQSDEEYCAARLAELDRFKKSIGIERFRLETQLAELDANDDRTMSE